MAIDLRSLKRVTLADPPGRADPSPTLPAHDVDDSHDAAGCELCAQIESKLSPGAPVDATADAPADPRVDVAAIRETAAAVVAAAVPATPFVPDAATEPDAAAVPANDAGAPHRRRLGVIAVCAAAVVAVAGIVVAAISHQSPTPSTPSTLSTPSVAASAARASSSSVSIPASVAPSVAAAVSWASTQLPHDAVLLADPSTRSALAAAGFTSAQAPGSASVPAFEYVFETPALQVAASADPGLAGTLASTVAVADFGSAAAEVTVRQAVADSAAVVTSRKATDSATRHTAELELLRNPALHASGNALAVLEDGQLDLRAATVLAYLANSTTVQLTNVSPTAAERAAGLPVRSVDVTIGAPAVMQTIVSGLPVAYQPVSVTALSTGGVRMVWPISAEPLPGLS